MNIVLLMKVVHVLTGALWLGGVAFAALFFVAAGRALGPAAAPVMKYVIGVRKLPVYMNSMAGLSLLTGLYFFDRVSGHFQSMPIGSFHGWALTLGSLFGVIAFVWGAAVPSMAAKKLGELTGKLTGPPTPAQAGEIERLQARLHIGGLIGLVLLLLAVAGMAMSHPV